ncbi:uncharacterized protein LOC128215143 [Mya arenaria]|uniref:uncharacterized protein LOC128215143 n=1 Tax=Mya arenaria TaxID=6604 RepID=UPI0022E227EE|nr:uncharacterized protein LOC128215143 [Mya arenaria]
MPSRKNTYLALVRAKLDYGSVVWYPYLKCDIDRLERIQRIGARFITGDYKSRQEGCVSQMLQNLQLRSLQERRRHLRLIFLYKVVEGHVPAIDIDQFLKTQRPKRTIRAKKFEDYINTNIVENSAVAQRHQLLSKCLIPVPHHLDAVESCPHRGNLPDVKYRFPWKRAKVDETFLEKEITQIQKDISLSDQEKSKDVLKVEYFESPCITNGSSFCEAVNFDLNCDVVCSSNPSSLEECFSPDEFFSEPQLFTEIFFKENIETLRPDCEVLMLEETIREDAFLPEGLKRIPTLAHLVSRFTPEHVEDPLLLASGAKILTQHDKILDGEDSVVDKSMLIEKINSSLFHDDWSVDKKQPDRLQDLEKESLEDVIVVDECFHAQKEKPCQSQLLDYLVSPQDILKIPFDQDVKDVIGRTFRLPATKTIGELESLDWKSDHVQMIDFVGINEIIVTALDKFCEVAYIAVPEEEVPELKRRALSLPDQKPFVDMACKSFKNLLLTEEERSRLEKIVWLEEKYFDDVQASRLPEPEAADACLPVPQNMVILASKTLGISEEGSLGKLDLALSWEVVPCSATPENPCKRLVDLAIDSTNFEVHVAEVEPIQAYDREFMFDWEDKLIEGEDEKKVRKSVVNGTGLEGGPFEEDGSKQVNVLKTMGKGRDSQKRGFDALESFLALRSKSVGFPSFMESTREPVKSKENGISAALAEISGIDRFSDTRAVVSKKAETARKVKHHTVKIPLSSK